MHFSEAHRIFSYLIIFFCIFIEGEILLLLAGVLSHRGYLDIFDVIVIAFVGAVLHDLLYWSLGRRLTRTNRKKFWLIDLEKICAFVEKLKFNSGLYIFISKFAWSLNRLILVTSGYLGISAKNLLRYSLPASLIWAIVFVSAGYVFASETDILKKDIKTAALFVAGFLILLILFENYLKRLLEKLIVRKNGANSADSEKM